MRAAAAAGAGALSAGLAGLPGWVSAGLLGLVAVFAGLVLLADGPVGRFERIVAAVRGVTPPGGHGQPDPPGPGTPVGPVASAG
jgi:hypothetical protein